MAHTMQPEAVKRIKIQCLRWLRHVTRMDSSNPVRKVFASGPGGGSRRKGRPRQRWDKQVTEIKPRWYLKLAPSCNSS